MGTGSEVPWRMTRLGIEEANGAQETFVLRQQKASHTRPDGKACNHMEFLGNEHGYRTKDL